MKMMCCCDAANAEDFAAVNVSNCTEKSLEAMDDREDERATNSRMLPCLAFRRLNRVW